MTSVGNILKSQLPIEEVSSKNKLPIELVDKIADELVAEYSNPNFRKWYCGIINKYGTPKVHEWRRRAEEGDQPGRLFTRYVNQAGGYRSKHK